MNPDSTMIAPLFDTHCHLDHAKFEGEVEEVMARAKAVGMWRMTTIGCARGPDEPWGAIDIARAHDWIVATAGVHPHDAHAFSALDLSTVENVAEDDNVVAIGEMGLDYHYDKSPRELQREVFRMQVALARQVKKPIIVHSREARADTLDILREENARDVGGIIHCFSEDPDFAKAALDLGFVSSFSGIVTFKSAVDIQQAAKDQPLDAILVETDAPYLAPIPFRGKRNEPSYAARTLEFIAELRGESVESLRLATSRNAARIFGMEPPPDLISA